jgi:cytochrome bd-type quinol oxidase subunit 2
MRIPQWFKPAFWGAVIGAVGIMIAGFTWWGWTTESTAQRMARERADAAVVTVLTPFCVASFLQQPDATGKLAEFRKASVWQQSQLVEKGGWATLAGNTTPNAAVARACAEELVKTKT